MTIEDAVKRANSETDDLEVVIAYRFIPGRSRPKPGSRVDLKCSICEAKVSLDEISLKLVAKGFPIICREACFSEIMAQVQPERVKLRSSGERLERTHRP